MKKGKSAGLFKEESGFSAGATLLFAVYNAYLGVAKQYTFALAIAAYYVMLSLARLLLYAAAKRERAERERGGAEKDGGKDGGAAQATEAARSGLATRQKKRYVFISALLFAVSLLLIGPIMLMVLNRRNYTLGLIPAIAVAAYSVYKITLAAVNYVKTGKTESDVHRLKNAFRLIDALASVLTLQNTLLIATGGAWEEDMMRLSTCSSAAIYALIAAISFVTFFRTIKKP